MTCPFCGAKQVPNTIFCSECGIYLLDDENKGTESLDFGKISWGDDDEEKTTDPLVPKTGQLAIRLKIGDHEREMQAMLTKAIHLGRLDPASDVFPEIDLTNDNGLEKGVSRRHARIIRRDSSVVVEDLGSINGTFVNGKRLTPYIGETLNDGDQLQLGNLMIQIYMG